MKDITPIVQVIGLLRHKKMKWFHLRKSMQELNPAQWTSDAVLYPIMWCRSFLYYTEKAACYTYEKASQIQKACSGSSEKRTDSFSILWQFQLELTQWITPGKEELCLLLIKWFTAVYYLQDLRFLQETDCLNMQIHIHEKSTDEMHHEILLVQPNWIYLRQQ